MSSENLRAWTRWIAAIRRFLGFTANTPPQEVSTRPATVPVSEPRSDEVERAVHLLGSRSAFDGWLVGFAAAPTDELVAFSLLLGHRSAPTMARALIERGQSGGIANGLCLLYMHDRPAFPDCVPQYRSRNDPIQLAHGGCTGMGLTTPCTLGEVVARIESGEYPFLLARYCESPQARRQRDR